MTNPIRSDASGTLNRSLSDASAKPRLLPDEAYNLFMWRRQPSLRCAVRVDHPVPAFIVAESWKFCQTVCTEHIPADFEPHAARQGSNMLGYYLFYALQE